MTTATHHDGYPSRVASEPSISPRHDPVVHPAPDAVRDAITRPAQLEYERDGYVVLEDVFTPEETAAMRAELEALGERDEVRDDPRTVLEPNDDTVRSIFEVHRLSDLFARVLSDARLVDPARRLLGDAVYVHQSRVNFKPALHGKEFFWHSDFETWHIEDGMPRMRAMSCSIALTDNTEFNGPLMVIPGSHHWYVACVGETPERHYEQSLRRQEYGTPDGDSLRWLVDQGGIAAPKVRAGSVVLFECNMMHASGVNLSPYPRSNVFVVYNSVDNALVAPYGVDEPRPSYIANRDPTPII